MLDWDGDLYDREVRTTFVARLRDEVKFDSVDALVAQIRAISPRRAVASASECCGPHTLDCVHAKASPTADVMQHGLVGATRVG